MPRRKAPLSTLPDAATDFLRDASQRLRTLAAYRTALLNFQAFAEATQLTREPAPLPATALKPETLAEYYSWLKKHNYRNASISLYLSTLGQYLLWLEASNKLPYHLRVAEMRAQLQKKIGQRGQRIRPDQRGSDPMVGALLGYYADELKKLPDDPKVARRERLILLRNQALLQTLYATAARVSEVVALQRADVAEGHATYVEIVGKGGRSRPLILTKVAQETIQAYLVARPDSAPGLFISHGARKEQPLTPQAVWRIVNDAAKAVFGTDRKGRPLKRVGPHAFRHLRAQNLSDEGCPSRHCKPCSATPASKPRVASMRPRRPPKNYWMKSALIAVNPRR
jgi:site-specific recombinase XerD